MSDMATHFGRTVPRSGTESAWLGSNELVEEGAAFMSLEGHRMIDGSTGDRITGEDVGRAAREERFQVVVIGAGQAGLSVGYHLARLGMDFVILEARKRIGDSWRKRWDSLRLFTSAVFDGLDGMPFPAPRDSFPTKDEMAAYLEAYAERFGLPVRTGVRVDGVSRTGDRYMVTAGPLRLEASQVVVAMSDYQESKLPAFAGELGPEIVQLHSSDYRNPGQLRDGGVLIVGAGNSGADLAMELARNHRVWMSGPDTGHIPFKIDGFWSRLFLARLVLRGVFHRLLTTDTPLGRKVRPRVLSHGAPLIRVKPRDLAAAGVKRVPRTTGTRNGLPVLEDGRVLYVANVIWCTGFRPDFSWIRLPVFDEDGKVKHQRGIAAGEPGLYFVGLHFLYSMSSSMIHGVGRDARRIAEEAASRVSRRKALLA